ncbi:MAG: YbhB/YbcL family Raf kinase inhibitor-like protein [Acidobacteria bacterium]|nr:YbhB/YbcL family Raf kinase inhibitor-like protein [Acidobacteriota bacterium]
MRLMRWTMVLMLAVGILITIADAQERGGQRGTAATPQPQRGAPPDARGGRGDRGGRGGGRGAVQTMTLVTTAWPDGDHIPLRYSQAGPEVSPAIQWSNVPPGTQSFVLVFRDLDTVVGRGPEGVVHWMVWNIPGTATGITQGRPDGYKMEDGSRQISASGFRYRGPGALASGPVHHYVMELYALDTMLDVEVPTPAPQGPNPNVIQIRDAIFQAMTADPGHIRGKAAYMGLFRRPQ